MRAFSRARGSNLPGVQPSTISNLQVWLKADSLSLADNAAVSSWVDSSNGLNFANATGAQQPTFKTNILNGLPVVRFDGTDDNLSVTSSVLVNSVNRTIFAVARLGIADALTTLAIFSLVSTNWYVGINSLERMFTSYQNSVGSQVTHNLTAEVQFSNNWWFLGSWKTETSGLDVTTTFRHKGAKKRIQLTSGGGHALPVSTTLRVGKLVSANWFHGDLAELIIYDRALTDVEITRVERYLGTKYNQQVA